MARVLGTETEYGIATPTDPTLSPIITSTHAVVAFSQGQGARWDFSSEHPLRDSRGFDLKRYHSVPVVDPNALGVANVVLENGGRFYVDHAHPEYSSPETTNPTQAMLYDVAGDVIVRKAIDQVAAFTARNHSILANHPPCPPLKIYKNNVDGKGASYGSHENYLYHRTTDFSRLAQSLIPFFVTRQVIIGAGRMGLGPNGEHTGFQISQRADYIEQEISLETTLNRGIINTRDEPHAAPDRFGRLHVILGDANMSHSAILLKLGMTSLVLDAIENGTDFSDLKLVRPVAELANISRDLSLTHRVELSDGRALTALEILAEYASRVQPDDTVHPLWLDVLEKLSKKGFRGCEDQLDWCAKWALISSYTDRGVALTDPKLALIDLQYADTDPVRGLYYALVRKGRMQTLVSEAEIAHAAMNPPENTRAYFRGELIKRVPHLVDAASWEVISIFGQRILLDEVTKMTKDDATQLLDILPDIPNFIAQLNQKGLISS
jgi:hypothetical protein